MNAQDVIKSFMAKLATHGLAYSSSVSTNMLNAAIRACSGYANINAAIKAMAADQIKAEKQAVKEIFGKSKLISSLTDDQRNQLAINNSKAKALSNAFYDGATSDAAKKITVEQVLLERKAYIFLEKYCGIELSTRYWVKVNGKVTNYGDKTGNTDTGAITGSDAGGDTVKTAKTIVNETFINTYTASTTAAQIIKTNSRDWVVQATKKADTITSGGADSINAGAGNDVIFANGNGATITTGAGNDTIKISEDVNDITINDLDADDTLIIDGDFKVSSAQIEDNLLVITDKTDGRKIRISSDATDAKVNDITISDWINGEAISSIDFEDSGISGVEVDLDSVNTAKTGKVKVNGKTVGKLSSTYPDATSFTRNGLTIKLLGDTSDTDGNPNNIESKTLDDLTDDQKTIIAGLFKWWGADCLKLNEDSYGIGFNSSTAMIKEIELYFYDGQGGSNSLATVWNWQRYDSDGYTTRLMLSINMDYYENIKASNMNGSSSKSGAIYLDRALAHEFTHAVMATNINFFNSLPIFIKEGSAELTHGIDDIRGSDIFGIAYDDTRLSDSLDVSNSTIKTSDSYAGGYMFFRYLAKQAASQNAFGEITTEINLNKNGNYYSEGIIVGKLANKTYTVKDTGVHQVIKGKSGVKVVGLTSNDTYTGTSKADTVQTAEGSNIITGAGNDSIKLYGQYATISASKGNDTVQVMDGSHHIIDLGAGNNVINFTSTYNYQNSITGGTGNDTITGGSNGYFDSVINLGNGKNKIEMYYGEDNTITTGTGKDLISVGGGASNFVNAGSGNDTIYVYGKNNTVEGGAGNDKIISGSGADWLYGGNGNDTLWGNGGNDSLYGGAGKDTFIYKPGDGTDTIFDYQSGDTLQILNSDGTTGGTFTKSTYKNDDLTLTISGGGKIILDGVNAGDTININNKNYTVSSKGLS